MPRISFVLITAIILGIVAGISYWFYTHFEQVLEDVYVGYQGEARYNPLLAMQRFLEKTGTPTRTVQSLPPIYHTLTTQDTLVIYAAYFDYKQGNQLLEWVKKGGHLIVVSNTAYDDEDEVEENESEDFVLRLFGIYKYRNDLENVNFNNVPATQITWADYNLQVDFDPRYSLQTNHDINFTVSDEYGTHVLHSDLEAGRISIFSDLDFISNDYIGKHDHAAFFWHLIHTQRTVGHIWLLRMQEKMPSLWTLLWQEGWMVIISIIILLFVWLWLISRRFGPLLLAPPLNRRRLLEHIEASGYFLWKRGQSAILLQGVRQTLVKRLTLVHPEWLHLPPDELTQRLAQLCNLPVEKVHTAWYGSKESQETVISFAHTVQVLAAIREKL